LLFAISFVAAGVFSQCDVASARTLGSVAPPNLGACSSCDAFQLATAAGQPSYRVPRGKWTITSWSAQGSGTEAGKARLRVYRATATPGQFMLVKQSHIERIPKNGHPTFATSLSVKGGDLLGLGTVIGVPSGYSTGVDGDNEVAVHCDPTGVGQLVGEGTSCPLANLTHALVNVKATLQRL
jgi:hypothetical protein